jgi:hypothetical protein
MPSVYRSVSLKQRVCLLIGYIWGIFIMTTGEEIIIEKKYLDARTLVHYLLAFIIVTRWNVFLFCL